MECESLAALKPVLSYKDMVTGGNVSPQHDKLIDLDDDDTELFEEDISVGFSDGVPTIHFFERFQSLAIKIIVNDYLKVLTEGPWKIIGHYINVEPWSIDFQPSQASPSRLMAWIRLLGLPTTLYKRSFLEETCPKLHPSTQSDTDSMQHDVIPPLANAETNPPVDAADKDLWDCILAQRPIPGFFEIDLEDWLLQNLGSNSLFNGTSIPWKILFASLLCPKIISHDVYVKCKKMRNKASDLLKQIIASLTMAIKNKTKAIKTCLVIFSLLQNKKLPMRSFFDKLNALMEQYNHRSF
ncbi:hypothetical protein V6N11_050155 [Hibiscus sabdariffa]|uniref:DUF4283 domain-containing protein n=2 Tax=Hibiscus sabdariffa TaxID=183260 RepID=A0ABR2T905_9ROSI